MATDPADTLSLVSGDNLTREEFLCIWEDLPEIERAELIGGIVYRPSPMRKEHGSLDVLLATWSGVYLAFTPGCEVGSNTTTLIGGDCLQPDLYLAILQECGGQSWGKKYVEGAPELIVEVSYSTASIDLHQKYEIYEAAGVQEYLVVVLKKQEIRWHRLVKGKYEPMGADTRGVFRSQVFPGLWLDGPALYRGDMARILACLQEGLATPEHVAFVAELAKRKNKS